MAVRHAFVIETETQTRGAVRADPRHGGRHWADDHESSSLIAQGSNAGWYTMPPQRELLASPVDHLPQIPNAATMVMAEFDQAFRGKLDMRRLRAA
jgi:hypothetical protein